MAESLKTVLGFDATNAIATLGAMEIKLKSWSTAMKGAASATRKFNKAAASTDASIKKASNSVTGFATAHRKNAAAAGASVTATQKVATATQKVGKGAEKAAGKVKKASGDMVLSWKSVIRIFAIQVIHQMISKITSSLTEGAAAAREYEKALGEIQTIGAEFQADFEDLADKVEAFSAATGQPLEAVTKGIYQTLSNQVVGAGESFEFLQTASDFAIGAVTDLDSSVNLLSAAINAYGLSSAEAEVAAGKLFKMIELGRVRGEEVADTFGRVLVLSGQLGVSLDEVTASMATLTVTGLKYNEAYTLITNVMLKLIKPTENLKARFDELGVSCAEAGIQAYGYQGFLEKIMEGSNKTATAIGKMFSRVRAIRGALGLTNEHAERYVKNLKAIKEVTAETIGRAKAFIWETNAKQVEIELNRVNVELTRLGRVATSASLSLMNAFGGGPEALTAIAVGLTTTIGLWIAMKVVGVTTLGTLITGCGTLSGAIAALKLASAALLTSPLFWAAAVGVAAAAAITWYNKAAKAAKEADNEIIASSKRRLKEQQRSLDRELKATKESTDKQFAAVQKFLFKRAKLYADMAKSAGALESRQFESIKSQLDNHTSAIQSFFDSVISKAEEANQKIKEINATISGIKANLSDWNFERALKGADPLRKTYAQIERSEQLRGEASRAARRGDIESAEALNQRAEAAAKAAVASADQSKNTILIGKAEEQVNKIMQGQISLLKNQKKEIKDQAAIAKGVEAAYRSQGTALDELADKFKDLKIKAADVKLDIVDRKKIEAEMKEVASKLEAMFVDFGKNVNIAKALDLKEEFTEANKGFFDPITGQIGGFEKVVNASIDRIEDRFTKFADSASADVKRIQASIDALVGKGTPAVQSGRVLQEGKEIGKSADARRDSLAAQEQLNTELDRSAGLENQYLEASKQSFRAKNYTAFSAKGLATAEKEITTEAATVLPLYRQAVKLIEEGMGATKEFEAVMVKLGDAVGRITERKGEKGMVEGLLAGDEAVVLETIIKSLSTAAEAAETVKSLQDQIDFGAKITAQLGLTVEPLQTLNQNLGPDMTDAANTGAQGVANAATSQISSLNAVAQAARQAAAAVAAVGSGGGSTTKAGGGLIYRSGGGYVPRGRDRIPAMLGIGETVINAASSRKFFSQLTAINAGRNPVYRDSGGQVTNVGDVHINMPKSQSTGQSVRDLAEAFRREIQRKTVRNF